MVALGWMFVVVLMAAAEATAPHGTLLGAVITLLGYGLLPLGIVLYILGTPARKAARRRLEAADAAAHAALPEAATEGPGSAPPSPTDPIADAEAGNRPPATASQPAMPSARAGTGD